MISICINMFPALGSIFIMPPQSTWDFWESHNGELRSRGGQKRPKLLFSGPWKKMLSRLEQETWGEMSCCWQRGADRVQCSSSIISTKTGAQECPQSTSTRVLTKAQLPLTAVYAAWSCLGPNYVIQAMLHFLQMLKFTILKACLHNLDSENITSVSNNKEERGKLERG